MPRFKSPPVFRKSQAGPALLLACGLLFGYTLGLRHGGFAHSGDHFRHSWADQAHTDASGQEQPPYSRRAGQHGLHAREGGAMEGQGVIGVGPRRRQQLSQVPEGGEGGLGLRNNDMLQAAPCAAAAQGEGPAKTGRIPKILHTVFIPDTSDPSNADLEMWPQHVRWVEACKYHFSPRAGWEYRYWNAASSEALIAEHYPSFLDFYRTNITLANEKSDIMRYLLMHRFGGLYLDSDTECWREAADMLEGYDVVLQGTHNGEGVGSAAIASVPGVPFWLDTLELVKGRSLTAITDEHPEWYKSIERTGPNLLRDTLIQVGLKADDEFIFEEHQTVNDLVYRVYRGGSWFLACQWWEQDCRKRVYQERASGQVDMSDVVGMHRFAGSWIAEKNNDKGRVDVKKELCARDLGEIRW